MIVNTAPTRRLRPLLAVAAAAALVSAGCGDSLPKGAVAKVGDTVITKQRFDQWFRIAARSTAATVGEGNVVFDPPSFRRCVAAKRAANRPARGAKPPSDADLLKLCRQQYRQVRDDVMRFLIQAEWLRAEARRSGIRVSPAEVRRTFEEQLRAAFPGKQGPARYRAFLRRTGMTERDVLERIELSLIQQRIQQRVQDRTSAIDENDIVSYYERNKSQFSQPERRDVEIVLTDTRQQALRAKREIESGRRFSEVAKRYSTDEISKQQGGRLTGVTRGSQERALDDAIFGARRNVLVGPVRTALGFYIFRVTRIEPAKTTPLASVRAQIRSAIESDRQQRALTLFVQEFTERSRTETICARGYVVSECRNGPPLATPGGRRLPASGGNPQGQGAAAQPRPAAGGGLGPGLGGLGGAPPPQ